MPRIIKNQRAAGSYWAVAMADVQRDGFQNHARNVAAACARGYRGLCTCHLPFLGVEWRDGSNPNLVQRSRPDDAPRNVTARKYPCGFLSMVTSTLTPMLTRNGATSEEAA
jgi:hypothetical protein